MKNDNKWRKGFPPHTGWWNASRSETSDTWRWFDAHKKQWGDYCNEGFEAKEAAQRARISAYETDDPDKQIKWRSYYPKDARVPRVDPRVKGPKVDTKRGAAGRASANAKRKSGEVLPFPTKNLKPKLKVV